MKKNKILAVMAAAVMAVSAAVMPASAYTIEYGEDAYAEFSSMDELAGYFSEHQRIVFTRFDLMTEYTGETLWMPEDLTDYESSISSIYVCANYISVTFTFANGSITLYDYGSNVYGKSFYESLKNNGAKQKVNGRAVYCLGEKYCWKQGGRYFVLIAGGNLSGLSYCSAEEYILPEYAPEGISYIGGKKYYVQSDGSYYVGWKTIDGKKYFFGMDGAAITQNMIIGNVRYTFEPSGVCTGTYTGWLDMEGHRYYCKNGRFVTGVNKISGKTYTFSSEGRLIS